MDKLLLHPHTRQLLASCIEQPTHGLLLEGERGVGLYTIAMQLARQLSPANDILTIRAEKNSISIDDIRTLYTTTRSVRDTALVIIIDDADDMGPEAQNALLKLLEEPPSCVYFILTSHNPQSLLVTIKSRVRSITVKNIPADLSKKYVTETHTTGIDTVKILFLGSGRPAELYRLINDRDYFVAISAMMADARLFIESDGYDRLIMLKPYMSDRDKSIRFVAMIGRLMAHSLNKSLSIKQVQSLDRVSAVLDALSQNANIRAQLLYLQLQLA